MNRLQNRVQLIGRLGGRPIVKELGDGRKLACFGLATTEVYRSRNGEMIRETQWHRMVAWGKIAEIAEKFLDKGKEIAVEGRLLSRSFTDKQGIRRYVSEVRVSEILMLPITQGWAD